MTENWRFFTFITVCKSFQPITFVLIFCTGFELSVKLCVLSNFRPKKLFWLLLEFFANFKPKWTNRFKKLKNVFYKRVLESHFTIIFYKFIVDFSPMGAQRFKTNLFPVSRAKQGEREEDH